MAAPLAVHLEFGGGAELLFDGVKDHHVTLPGQSDPSTIEFSPLSPSTSLFLPLRTPPTSVSLLRLAHSLSNCSIIEPLSLVNAASDTVDGSFMPNAGVTGKVWSGVGALGGLAKKGGMVVTKHEGLFVCNHFGGGGSRGGKTNASLPPPISDSYRLPGGASG
ncbi:hypothetical protein SRHO_G00219660 [Serrasalmus rhombeus]